MSERIEKKTEEVRSSAWGLYNCIEELFEEEGINMYDEVLEYLKEKQKLNKEI